MEEKIRTTCRFLEKKIREYELLATEIQQLQKEVQASGFPSERKDRSGRL
jgi:hypothetical protein